MKYQCNESLKFCGSRPVFFVSFCWRSRPCFHTNCGTVIQLRPDVNVIMCCGGVISKYHDIYLIEQHNNGDSVPGLDPVSVSLRLCVSVDPMTAPDSPRRTGEYDGFLIWSPNVRATSSAFSQFALTPN